LISLSNTPTPLRVGILFSLLLLVGCSAPLQSVRLIESPPPELSPAVELEQTPFYPQQRYQCGPAALATVLDWSGVTITPEALVPEVYLPGREGSLQLELVAATRRHGRVPYPLAREMSALLEEIQAGHPVLVLQNLGLSWIPRWHYAVVVGYDLQQEEIVLRSGEEPRHQVSIETFERTWRRGNYWALVVLPPDRLPTTAEELPYLQSVLPFEQLGNWQIAQIAYRTAAAHWPQSTGARLGLGNTSYMLKKLPEAEAAYREAINIDDKFAPALNNLAQTLADRGQWKQAEHYAQRAVSEEEEVKAYRETLQQIQQHLANH
jgi:tetratricopeptide (TPR) repeat protein